MRCTLSLSSCGICIFAVAFPTSHLSLSLSSFFLPVPLKLSGEGAESLLSLSVTVEQNFSAQHPLLVKMPEIQLGAHTLRSHGVQVARIHMHDWLILLLLVIIDIVLNVIEPFHRFVGKNMMEDLMYPFKGNTVPFWAVPIIAILLPFLVILIYYFIRKDVYDFHQAILGLLFSVLITSVITDAIKDGVGRPRPDFFWRCFPDGKGVFNNVTGLVQCTGLKSDIKEGHKSFPSGHSSWSFAGLTFLAWYLGGKIRVFDRRGHVAKLCLVLTPMLLAAMVAVSRVDDYWHHWQDVFAGGLLGVVISSFCYLQFFPAPYETDGWGPHAYFHMLEASRNGLPTTNNNALSVRPTEMENVIVQSHHDPGRPEFDHYPSMPNPDGVEGGMRL